MDTGRHSKAGAHGKAGAGVGGRLRQRLARMLLHSSCATTSAAAFVGTNAVAGPAGAAANAGSRQDPPPPARCAHEPQHMNKLADGDGSGRRQLQRRHRRRGARALVHISIDCSTARSGVGAANAARYDGTVKGNGSGGGNTNKPLRRSPFHGCSSSSDTDGEEADTRSSALFSSRSFSSDSTSDLYYNNNTGGTCSRSSSSRRHSKKAPRRRPSSASGNKQEKEKNKLDNNGNDDGAAAAIAAAAGSTAVVKRSHNPYADFRSSMAEMVAGRRIRGADALSELLVWYLSLNAPRHHPAILAAFEDVLEAVVGDKRP